jgi:hypothetical protein
MTEAVADCEGVGLTEGKKPKPAGPPRTEVDEERTSAILHGTGSAKAPARAVDIHPLVQVDARAPLRPLGLAGCPLSVPPNRWLWAEGMTNRAGLTSKDPPV